MRFSSRVSTKNFLLKYDSGIFFKCTTIFILHVPKAVSNSKQREPSFVWHGERRGWRAGFLHDKHSAIHWPGGEVPSPLPAPLPRLASPPPLRWPGWAVSPGIPGPLPQGLHVTQTGPITLTAPGKSGTSRSRHLPPAGPASFPLINCAWTSARKGLSFVIQKPQPSRLGAKAAEP